MEEKKVSKQKTLFNLSLCVAAVLALLMTAGSGYAEMTQTAVIVNAASNYSSGAHSVVSVDPVGGPRTVQNDLSPTKSDLTVVAYGHYFYRIGRYQMDNVTKFDIHAPDTAIWQFSVLNKDEESCNPNDLVFVNETKAYLLRYGSAKAWIVNPSATKESEFKIGELDLSGYDDGDGIPEMHSGVIVNGKLFITLQRQDRTGGYGNWILGEAWVAVIDTATDKEIATGKGNGKMLGIPIPAKNPQAISYLAENKTIYVQCAGDLMDAEYSGGIVSINPETYETKLILDDGDAENHPYGNISGMAFASASKGYFVGYAGWEDNSLYVFNPSTGAVSGVVNELKNKNIAGMESGAYPDKNGMLWVCNATDAEIVIINPADNSIDEKISTHLNPIKIAFCEEFSPGWHVTDKLWIRGVIKSEEKGEIEAIWHESGREKTTRGDEVIYGHFYASPNDVTWGSSKNPDVFVKIWFDVSGRLDVNFFHVSVPEVKVYSAFPYEGTPKLETTVTTSERYIRHVYENGKSSSVKE